MGDRSDDLNFLQVVSEFIGRTQEAIKALKADIEHLKRSDEKSTDKIWDRLLDIDKSLSVLGTSVSHLATAVTKLETSVEKVVDVDISGLSTRVGKVESRVARILYWSAGAAAAVSFILYLISQFWK